MLAEKVDNAAERNFSQKTQTEQAAPVKTKV